MLNKYRGKLVNSLLVLSYVAFVILVWHYVSTILVDKQSVRDIVAGFGIFAPIVFILIQIGQNIVAPIAHYPILLAGGFIFGSVVGFFYNWIGTVLGTVMIVFFVRRFGRPLVDKMVNKKFVKKYDHIIQKLSPFGLFLIYALPIFPDDEITYLIALSSMPVKSIIFAIVVGKIPGAAISFIGDETIKGILPVTIIQIFVLVAGSVYFFRKNIQDLFNKLTTGLTENRG